MKLLFRPLLVLSALSALASASSSFGGSNLYFLHGLSASDQANYIDTLASYGAKVVRVWVTGLSTGCTKGSNVVTGFPDFETTLGTYNYQTLTGVDNVLAQLAAKGIKAIISPHDGNLIHGSGTAGNGCDVYCSAYGTSFYSNSAAQAYYDARIKAILTYKSPSSGKTWGSWSDAILGFDLQNEPFQFTSDGANNDPSGWLCGRAKNFKQYITDSNIKVATGGIGGDQSHNYNMLSAALKCSSIHLMSVHGYVGDASTWGSILPNFESQASSNGKLLYVEEWGVASNYNSGFDAQAAAINAQKIPWIYWEMIPGQDAVQGCTSCCSGFDGFELGLHSSKGNAQVALQAAESETAVQDWSFAGFTGGGGSGTTYPADTCTWGCEGWNCNSNTPCQSAYSCVNGICGACTWGCNGWSCSASQPCNADYTCVGGVCHHSGPATRKLKRSIGGGGGRAAGVHVHGGHTFLP